jgi:glutamyl-tRNA reductase
VEAAAGGRCRWRGLERLHYQLVLLVTPIFTLAIVTGVLWTVRAGGVESMGARWIEILMAVTAWLSSVGVLVLRVGLGLRGRRLGAADPGRLRLHAAGDRLVRGALMTDLLAVGLNHKTAPVELRERLAFGTDELRAALRACGSAAELGEVMIVSTCNRVEVYAAGPSWARCGERVLQSLAELRGVPLAELLPHTFVRGEQAAASHIFRVAASLESMVVGEPQILGQVKDAFELAQREGTVGGLLDRCMSVGVRAAKRVRTETEIARGAASVPSVAVDLARSIFGELTGCGALLVGAGEMAQQAGLHLKAGGVAELTVVNRSPARGAGAGDRDRRPLRRVGPARARAASRRHRRHQHRLAAARDRPQAAQAGDEARRGAPIFLVDIAVPRDVDPEVTRLEQVFLYNIDDLQGIVHDNLRGRSAEAERANALVEQEVAQFISWQRSRGVGPLMKALQAQGARRSSRASSRACAASCRA